MRLVLAAMLMLIGKPVWAQVLCNGQACAIDGSSVSANAKGRMLYMSSGSVTVGNNSAARSTMLPPGIAGSSLLIKANSMPPGTCLVLSGTGAISAAMVGAGSFTFTPTMTTGGTKTDLGGLTVAPLIGVSGIAWLDLKVCQTVTGILVQGVISYAQANSANNYPNLINASGTIVASDYTQDRTFGVDGQWAVANAANYVTPTQVAIYLWPLAP